MKPNAFIALCAISCPLWIGLNIVTVLSLRGGTSAVAIGYMVGAASAAASAIIAFELRKRND